MHERHSLVSAGTALVGDSSRIRHSRSAALPSSDGWSDYARQLLVPSPANLLMRDFEHDFRPRVDVNLGMGYVNHATIPAEQIHAAMALVLSRPDMYPEPLNYGEAGGTRQLVAAIRRFHERHQLGGLTAERLAELQIVIGLSGATSLLAALTHIFPPGAVLTPAPMYYIYKDMLERRGFRIVAVPEDDEGLDIEAAAEALASMAEPLRFVYVCTVNNPTCTILSTRRRAALLALLETYSQRVGQRTPVFFDKAYEELIHDPQAPRPKSALMLDRSGLAYEIGTLSKVLAPGLRIGYLMGMPGPIMDVLAQYNSDTGFHASIINQQIAAHLLDSVMAEHMPRLLDAYRVKARAVSDAMDQLVGEQMVKRSGGQAGFYHYLTLDVPTGKGSRLWHFCTRTTGDVRVDGPPNNRQPRLIYLPGEEFVPSSFSSPETARQLRLSYGYESVEQITRGLHILADGLRYATDALK